MSEFERKCPQCGAPLKAVEHEFKGKKFYEYLCTNPQCPSGNTESIIK